MGFFFKIYCALAIISTVIMLWLITSIFVDRFIQIYKYEKFIFSKSEPEPEEEEEIVSNVDLTYSGQVSYHFKRKGGKSKSPDSAKPKPSENKDSGKGTF